MEVVPRTVVLLVEDPDMRLYLRSCLRSLTPPFERLLEAADGLHALRMVRSDAVALVISDVELPGLDGRRLRRAIRDDAALSHVAVLLISDGNGAGEPAPDGVLVKPFNGRQLLAALDELS
jgi:CheY-like chemotaxis protein